MKKLLALILTLCVFLSLTACSAFENLLPSKSDDPASKSTQYADDLDNVPEFDGLPYVVINNNEPYFKQKEITNKSFESYSALDSLGRCGVTIASVGKDIMPTEERGEIGQIKPSGWQTVKYDIVSGKYLYNRCHLIGYQLTGENANPSNLITGTRYLNIDGMLPFEDLVADYVKETSNHVMYRVTPIFRGNELVARGVLMEGLSVEDSGSGVKFNVYCYNVQPGITIDYMTGESALGNTPPAKSIDSTNQSQSTSPSTSFDSSSQASVSLTTYILNTNSKKFHLPTCSGVKNILEANKKTFEGTRAELISDGYSPCGTCKP